MASSRGRPGPEAGRPSLAEPPAAALSRGGPGRTPSQPPSGLRAPAEEEAAGVGGAGRRAGPSAKAPSAPDPPGPRAPPAAAGHDASPPARRPDPAPGGARRGGGAGVDGEPPRPEERARREDEPGRAGRAFPGRLQDSRSLDGLSGACAGPEGGAGGGRRATIASPLELEGTVSRHGDLTHFVANNLQLKIRLSAAPPALPPAPARPGPAPTPSIPPIDPDVLRDLERLSRELGGRVDRLLRGLGGAVQELTALSVGCIQTYRDAVDSLGEAVDMSIKGMYTLLARCEELERALQPVQGLARQIRDIRRTLEVLEALCK